MTTRCLRIALVLLVSCSSVTTLPAAPLGQVTPGACTVGGCCVPEGEWGYRQTNWRRWPGSDQASTSRGDGGTSQGGPQLPPVDKPEPEFEDQAAPPKVEELDPDSEEGGRESDIDLPDFPGPEEGSPGDETPTPRPRAPRPEFMNDPPEGLPFGDPPANGDTGDSLPFGQPPSTPAPTPADNLFPLRLNPGQGNGGQFGNDSPPPLPFAGAPGRHRRPAPRRQAQASAVQQASFTAPAFRSPRAEPIQARVQRTGHSSDAPPALPALFRSPAGR